MRTWLFLWIFFFFHSSIAWMLLSSLWQVFMYWWIYGTIVFYHFQRSSPLIANCFIICVAGSICIFCCCCWCDNLIFLPYFGLQSTLIYNNWLIGWSFESKQFVWHHRNTMPALNWYWMRLFSFTLIVYTFGIPLLVAKITRNFCSTKGFD